MSDYLMVPAKYSILSVANKNERIVYVPVATKETTGVVKIGDGLKIDYYGLLSLDDDITGFISKVNSGDVMSKGFYEHRSDFKYPVNTIVYYEKEFYLSLSDDNVAELTDDNHWKKLGIRSQLEAKEVILENENNLESTVADIYEKLNNKVDRVSEGDAFLIDNTSDGIYLGTRHMSGSGANVNIGTGGVKISTSQSGTQYGSSTTETLYFGGKVRVISKQNNEIVRDTYLATLLDTEKKQDKKPDGNIELINPNTGKLDNSYLPSILTRGSRRFAGTFGEDGVVVASAYASEVQGLNINEINLDNSIGYEFAYTGENPFVIDGLEIYKNDIIVCNGNQEPNWTLYDNSDKVVSVNGKTGAVELNFATLDDVNNAIGNVSSLLGNTEDLEA